MGNLGFWEIAVLGVIALLVFGPERLPDMARNAGKALAQLKREANSTLRDLRDAAAVDDDVKAVAAEMRAVGKDLRDARDTVAGSFKPGSLPDTRAAPFDPDAT